MSTQAIRHSPWYFTTIRIRSLCSLCSPTTIYGLTAPAAAAMRDMHACMRAAATALVKWKKADLVQHLFSLKPEWQWNNNNKVIQNSCVKWDDAAGSKSVSLRWGVEATFSRLLSRSAPSCLPTWGTVQTLTWDRGEGFCQFVPEIMT